MSGKKIIPGLRRLKGKLADYSDFGDFDTIKFVLLTGL